MMKVRKNTTTKKNYALHARGKKAGNLYFRTGTVAILRLFKAIQGYPRLFKAGA